MGVVPEGCHGWERPPPTPIPSRRPHLCTSRPGQAAATQGKAVVASPQRAVLQGGPQVPHAGERPAPALQHDCPGSELDGELPQAQALGVGSLQLAAAGVAAVSRGPGRERAQPRPRTPRPHAHLVALGHCEDEAVEVAGAPLDKVEASLRLQLGQHEWIPRWVVGRERGTIRAPGGTAGPTPGNKNT